MHHGGCMKAVILGIVAGSLMSIPAMAKDNVVGLSYGIPVKEQNLTVQVLDLTYERNMYDFFDGMLDVGMNARIGNIRVGHEHATRLGAGVHATLNLGDVFFTLPLTMLWLDKNAFGLDNPDHTKNYGGELQFSYVAVAGYRLTESWSIFYRYAHMSNGENYEHNPALDTHNFGVKYRF